MGGCDGAAGLATLSCSVALLREVRRDPRAVNAKTASTAWPRFVSINVVRDGALAM
jgi:hypothetical protein